VEEATSAGQEVEKPKKKNSFPSSGERKFTERLFERKSLLGGGGGVCFPRKKRIPLGQGPKYLGTS